MSEYRRWRTLSSWTVVMGEPVAGFGRNKVTLNCEDITPSPSKRKTERKTSVRILIPQEDLERRIAELAAEIDRDYAASDRLVCIGVLKGSVYFMVDLLKRLRVPLAIDFFQTSSYGSSTSPGEVRIRKDLDLSIRGTDRLLS